MIDPKAPDYQPPMSLPCSQCGEMISYSESQGGYGGMAMHNCRGSPSAEGVRRIIREELERMHAQGKTPAKD